MSGGAGAQLFSGIDAARCAEAIVDRAGRDLVLALPIGIGKPLKLVNALYALVEADKRLRLRIFTGLTLIRPHYKTDLERRFVAPLLERLFASYPTPAYTEALRQGRLPSNIEVREFFFQAGAWLSAPLAQQSYASLNYTHVARHLQSLGANVFAQLVAPRPDGGKGTFSLSCNTDVTLDMRPYIEGRRRAGLPMAVAGEVNANLPYMPNAAEVPREQFDVLLEPEGEPYELFAPPKEPVPLADYAMALHAAPLIKDGGTLQIGIGSFADAFAHVLVLRHTRNAEFRDLLRRLNVRLGPDAETGPFTHGLYGCSEMLVDGFLALMKAGVLKRTVQQDGKPVLLHAGFFIGSKAFYRALKEMPPEELARIAMTGISFTNSLLGEEALKREHRRDARFVNTAMTATLLGAFSSDALDDQRVISGVGGQHDFVAQAHDLDGARSILALRAVRSQRGRDVSNIVWRYANTTVPRSLRDIAVTEYGAADLRGKSDRDTIAAMLGIADSAFQPALQRQATAIGKLERGFAIPQPARANTRERISAALDGPRAAGLLPRFPLGTEMTDVEQALVPPLGLLRSGSPAQLAAVLLRGLTAGPVSEPETLALERMALDKPASFKEHAQRALILGALRTA